MGAIFPDALSRPQFPSAKSVVGQFERDGNFPPVFAFWLRKCVGNNAGRSGHTLMPCAVRLKKRRWRSQFFATIILPPMEGRFGRNPHTTEAISAGRIVSRAGGSSEEADGGRHRTVAPDELSLGMNSGEYAPQIFDTLHIFSAFLKYLVSTLGIF